MDETIAKISTPEGREQFALNVEERSPERAQAARRRAVELRADLLAAEHGAETQAERESIQAICAYERTLYKKHGKHKRAAYTWRMVRARGIIPAVENAVMKPKETAGFRALEAEGMLSMAFEAVVLRHPEVFSSEAIAASQRRMDEWNASQLPNEG